jgi:acetyltransferase-like isoleucine patch superfamily enzyme
MIKCLIRKKLKVLIFRIFKCYFDELLLSNYKVHGSKDRLSIHENANVTNSLFNTFSGKIKIDAHSFTGHNVCFLTGTHNYNFTGPQRMFEIPDSGYDIHVKEGVWIGSNSTIIGPCTIGNNAVVAAGSIVTKDVESNCIVAGCPAKIIKKINTL